MSQNYSRLLSQGDASSTTSMIKGAVIGKIMGILVLVSFIALLGWLATKLFEKYFPQLKASSKEVGQDCLESFECIGYKVGDGPACCGTVGSKTCTQKVKDLAGNWYCPEEATGQKKLGDPCDISNDCHGYKVGDGPACCLDKIDNKKKCTAKVKDLAGNWYCPEEATGQKKLGDPCDISNDCHGYKVGDGPACCGPEGQKTCTAKVKDLAGNWYCPSEATGQKGLGSPCTDSYQCAGYKAGSGPACCGLVGKKTCTNKQKDWAGNWYCPLECVGAFAGKPGTCK